MMVNVDLRRTVIIGITGNPTWFVSKALTSSSCNGSLPRHLTLPSHYAAFSSLENIHNRSQLYSCFHHTTASQERILRKAPRQEVNSEQRRFMATSLHVPGTWKSCRCIVMHDLHP